jgi:mycobactin lysine-N-oxygenase
LLVLGAGPKAAAIAAKSFILNDLGHEAPEVFVVERYEKCANWTGRHGFTNGDQILGTPPEKDIGFPYLVDPGDSKVTKALFSRFSWTSYLIKHSRYGEWIDRGRPHPAHKEWAEYLDWVLSQTTADRYIPGRLDRLELDGEEWIAHFIREDGKPLPTHRFSGVVITGPGARKPPPFPVDESPMILYGDTFWRDCTSRLEQRVRKARKEILPIVVVGGGETAAAIVGYLVDRVGEETPILVLTRSGAIFSRGESYYENRRFTGERDDWRKLPEKVRREVIDRADRGVFSVDAMRKLSTALNVNHEFRKVEALRVEDDRVVINPDSDRTECQMLIWALGFDPYWFIDLLPKEIADRLNNLVKSKKPSKDWAARNRAIEARIEYDLSLARSLVPAKLFVPMISGYKEGPGFPNLSCLGDLSDRILGRRR